MKIESRWPNESVLVPESDADRVVLNTIISEAIFRAKRPDDMGLLLAEGCEDIQVLPFIESDFGPDGTAQLRLGMCNMADPPSPQQDERERVLRVEITILGGFRPYLRYTSSDGREYGMQLSRVGCLLTDEAARAFFAESPRPVRMEVREEPEE